MASFSKRFDADHRCLSDARAEVSAWLERSAAARSLDPERAIDLALVVTELAANAIDHSTTPWVWLDVDVDDDGAVVEVSNLGSVDDVPPVEEWASLEPTDRGRGLRIVQALTTNIEVGGDDGSTRVRCRLPLS